MPTTTSLHPLARLAQDRDIVSEIVCSRLLRAAPSDSKQMEEMLGDSLFWEKKRLASPNDPVRDAVDGAFWKMMAHEIPAAAGDAASLRILYEKLIRFHLGEISSHFDQRTYKVATTLVPRGFVWLLQALSWKSLAKMFQEKPDLRGKVVIQGQLEQLRKLSQKGTIILTPTHFSNLDSMLMGWALFDIGLPPFAYGAGLNLFTNPVLGYFMNNLGTYKVDRKKKHKLYREILKEYSTTILERRVHSLFFPGGGRSRSGGLETKIKTGLLGTGVSAYIRNLQEGRPNPNVYIVPCVISYHFVLEASSLIADYLKEQGQGRYMPVDEDSLMMRSFTQFIYKFFSANSKIHMNFGRALDPFGHLVDDDGNSVTDRGRMVDPADFVRTDGEVRADKQRDDEYTRILSERLVERFAVENVVLSSHFVAYSFFLWLKRQHPEKDLFRLLRLAPEETRTALSDFLPFAEHILLKLRILYHDGKLVLPPALRSCPVADAVTTGLRNVGIYHTLRPLKMTGTVDGGGTVLSEDMELLYYYHNRMAGYGITP